MSIGQSASWGKGRFPADPTGIQDPRQPCKIGAFLNPIIGLFILFAWLIFKEVLCRGNPA